MVSIIVQLVGPDGGTPVRMTHCIVFLNRSTGQGRTATLKNAHLVRPPTSPFGWKAYLVA